jgi:DNA-binding FrmR family transcriptional regulator
VLSNALRLRRAKV